jgi:hypothetical protein
MCKTIEYENFGDKVRVIKHEPLKFVGYHKSIIVLNESNTFAKDNLHKPFEIYNSTPQKQHLLTFNRLLVALQRCNNGQHAKRLAQNTSMK